jgi:hypothetical protein
VIKPRGVIKLSVVRKLRLHTRLLAGLICAGAVLVPATVGRASTTATAQLTLEYTAGGVLEVILGTAAPIRTSTAPGATIPPGTYQVVVNNDFPDISDPFHMFHLAGPGVNLQTDMGAGDNKTELYVATLAANSTYTFGDDRQPGAGHVVFSTSSTASSSTSTGSSGGGSASGSTGGSSSNSGVVGSSTGAGPFRGRLDGRVPATGKPTLTVGGRPVATLLKGRYSFAVVDRSSKGAFTVQQVSKKAINLTSLAFVGKHTVTVALSTGRWMFYSAAGKKSYFVVVD